jgi:DNA-binding NarL/FixJ family response regulator
MNSLRLFFTEDQEIVRKGITGFIEKRANMDMVGSASDAATAVRMAREFKPEVMIMDVAIPQSAGIQPDERIRIDTRDETFRALCEVLTQMAKLTKAGQIKVTLYRKKNTIQFSPDGDEGLATSGEASLDGGGGSEFALFNMQEPKN